MVIVLCSNLNFNLNFVGKGPIYTKKIETLAFNFKKSKYLLLSSVIIDEKFPKAFKNCLT